MKAIFVFLVLLFITHTAQSKGNIRHLVNYYQKWFEKRTREATVYEFPKDARMHEARIKIPKGN